VSGIILPNPQATLDRLFKENHHVRVSRTLIFSFALSLLLPALAQAQASITGTVKDTSGAVLPGVTVEAASPALIEKSRSVVTDGTGQYRIVDLRPGAYSVTFTLAGFNTVKREGLELTGSFTATLNADLRVGALEETVTVSGDAPVVDVQSAGRQRVFGHDVVDAVPTAKSQYNIAVLIPGMSMGGGAGVTQQDVGGSSGLEASFGVTIHGGKLDSQRITQNGIIVNTYVAGGYGGAAAPNPSAVQELTVDTSGVSAELSTGGVRINLIPKDGGNMFKGVVFGTFANSSMQGSNLTQALKDRGLPSPNSIKEIWDVNPGFGGRIKTDTLWFYGSLRQNVAESNVAGMFLDNNNNPNIWTFAPDSSQPASQDNTWKEGQIRLTWQASARNKFALSYDQQTACYCPNGVTAIQSVEASYRRWFPTERSWKGDWTFPLTSRLLFEGSVVHTFESVRRDPKNGLNPQLISVTEQGGAIPGLLYRSNPTYSTNEDYAFYYRVAVSYITGAHAFKVGFNNGKGGVGPNLSYALQPISYRFNNGVPNQITLNGTPFASTTNVDNDLGVYAQDRWTLRRLTLTLGVRYDYFADSFPEQTVGPALLAPNRNVTFPAQDNVAFQDITPKSGAVYDLFGNGHTALKVGLNKYLQGMLSGVAMSPNPVSTLITSTNRSWTDANFNYVADCDLTNPAAQDNRATGGDFCGQMANTNFGKVVPGATFDPATLRGWGQRNYNWEFSSGVQQRLGERISAEVSYFRRWFGNFTVTDNLATAPSDYSLYSIAAPLDSRLPGGGAYTIGGLYDLNPAKFGVPAQNYVTLSDRYGTQIEHWNGFDVNLSARPGGGLLFQGGVSTGRTTTDNCDVVTKLDNPSPLYCHVDTLFLTQVKALGSYLVPRAQVQISGTFQSIPGPPILATYTAPNAVIAPSLGRNLSGNATNATVNLVSPGTMYGERLNQVDLRIGKVLTYGRTRAAINLDIYNAFNASPVLSVNNNFAAWQVPTSILTARFVKISAQIDF
jgi:hypothetical protein